jgi:hypothetical protein
VALSQLDADGDEVVDAQEAQAAGLLLWFDDNADGRSGPGELRPFAEYLSQVSLVPIFSDWKDGNGNSAPLKASARSKAGQELTAYDFYLSWGEAP